MPHRELKHIWAKIAMHVMLKGRAHVHRRAGGLIFSALDRNLIFMGSAERIIRVGPTVLE